MPVLKFTLTAEQLATLSPKQRAFYQEARRAFQSNMPESTFLSSFFSDRPTSPLFESKDKKAVTDSPLYVVLREMWLELGVNQGTLKRPV
jgi:hypothetical protein